MSIVLNAHATGRAFTESITREEQKSAGQFMTPPIIARFMARRLVANFDHSTVRLLEPSAGAGVLVAAVVEALLDKARRPKRIEILLYERDARLITHLESLCDRLGNACATAGIAFDRLIRNEDFLLSDLAIRGQPIDGLLSIANPPFFKLNKGTDERAKLHSYAVYGQPNIYGLFMAATARLTPENGRWCFIAPRSWMSGQYFKAVRRTVLKHLQIDSLHAFENRRESFEEDSVLQETVIFWASGRRGNGHGLEVSFTSSIGVSDIDITNMRHIPFDRIVASNDGSIVVPPSADSDVMDGWDATLATYGLKVSTGPVVAFRAENFITATRHPNTVPLLWMQHVGQQTLHWPIQKKSEFILANGASAWMLLPNAPMVVMRRFSPKEDPRRVTCAPYAGQLPGHRIGLENHLNYIHRPSGQMSVLEVRGLSALLASRVVDAHLRRIAGSTQINATDLRKLPLPSLALIEEIGRSISNKPALAEIDAITEQAIGLRSFRAAA